MKLVAVLEPVLSIRFLDCTALYYTVLCCTGLCFTVLYYAVRDPSWQPIADWLRHRLAWQRAQAPAFQVQDAVWLVNEGAELLWVAEHTV